MSQPPPPPHGYPHGFPPPEGYASPAYPPQGYAPQGYAPQGYSPAGYAPQYGFWPHYAAAPDALLAPARRAGWCLIGLGIVALVIGTIAGSAFGALTDAQIGGFLEQLKRQQPANAAALNAVAPHQVRLATIAFGVIVGGWGALGVTLGLLSRTGRLGWTIVGLTFSVLTLLYLAFSLAVSAASNANPASGLAGGICVFGLPAALLVAAIAFFVRAIRNAPILAAARQQAAYAIHYGTPPV